MLCSCLSHCVPRNRLIHQFNEQIPCSKQLNTTVAAFCETPRSGQQAAIGVDVIALMDALKLNRAILAGYDWGGRAACVVAASGLNDAQVWCPSIAT